jgi:hypothetical protein
MSLAGTAAPAVSFEDRTSDLGAIAFGSGNNSLWVPKTSSGLAVSLGAMMAA